MVDFKENEQLNTLNHSCAHVMAQAIKHLYPQAKFWVGPVVAEGFYYDVDLGDEVVSDEAIAKIEKEMKKICKDGKRIVRREISKEEALEMFNKIDKNAFEVLDFICGCGKYYIINIIKIVDCIDMEKSVYKTYKMDPDTIVKYKKLFFKWDNIKDNKIFWLKHLEGGLLVCTDEVKNQIENAHLYGLGFELLGEN